MTTFPRATRSVFGGLVALLAGVAVSVVAPGPALAQKPPQEWDGLQRRESKSLAHVYVRPHVEFKGYKSVRLDPVDVRMDRNWDPNSGRVGLEGRITSDDVQRIRGELSKAFREVFAERLAKGGYPLVETNGDDVLLVRAALIDVIISAPESSQATGASRSYMVDPGRMTVFMELVDSVTGQTLARVVDTKEGPKSGLLQWSTSATNSAGARWVIGQWADVLRKGLDEVNSKAAGK